MPTKTDDEASVWIRRLGLEPHPEGGYFAESYRSADRLGAEALPERYAGSRCAATAIYFLLRGNEVSHFHRLRSDEIWHWYTGSSLTLFLLTEDGRLQTIDVGPDFDAGQTYQARVPHGSWFAARIHDPDRFALIGCTVSPGFDFADFELADREALLSRHPQHAVWIERFTPAPASRARSRRARPS